MKTHMKVHDLFRTVDHFERSFCLYFNQACNRWSVKTFFAVISRLGNGVFWYVLMALLPFMYGREGFLVSARMFITGVLGVLVYKFLKTRLVRQRPYMTHNDIQLGALPLDLYSFPSGHTMHAVSFTLIVMNSFPLSAWLLVPFTVMVAMSRVVLGLHYPTDVLAGVVLGVFLSWFGLSFF